MSKRGNPSGVVSVMDNAGKVLGMVDGHSLTTLRTGAACGLATDLLSRRDVQTMAMLGAGSLSFDQVAGVLAVRPRHPGRQGDTQVTFFKSVGIGSMDVAAGVAVLRLAGYLNE